MDLAEGLDIVVAENDVAALDKVLIALQVVEAPHDGPHCGGRGVDLLHHGGAPLV